MEETKAAPTAKAASQAPPMLSKGEEEKEEQTQEEMGNDGREKKVEEEQEEEEQETTPTPISTEPNSSGSVKEKACNLAASIAALREEENEGDDEGKVGWW